MKLLKRERYEYVFFTARFRSLPVETASSVALRNVDDYAV